VGIADADRKSATVHAGVKVEDAEHLHAVLGSSIFFLGYADVTKAEVAVPSGVGTAANN
jgi:hypothetical protein